MEVGWLELRLQHMSCKSVDRYLEVEADDSRWLGSSRRWSSFPHVDTAFDGDAQHVEKWPKHLVIACRAGDRAAFGDSWLPNFVGQGGYGWKKGQQGEKRILGFQLQGWMPKGCTLFCQLVNRLNTQCHLRSSAVLVPKTAFCS